MKSPPLVLLACAAACGSHAAQPQSGTQAPQQGIYTADLDRGADPCTDFFQFANGTWRRDNPIPASMGKWSRRWQAGETSKDRLKEILDEVSARTDWPRSSVEQQIGDLYAGCMDEARIEQLGLGPLQPLLAEIDRVKTPADLVPLIARFHAMQIGVPFELTATSDLHTPTNVVAWVTAGGLGLPDRDYYVKDDPRFSDARTAYLAHVAAMFVLAGRDGAAAARAADVVMAIELGFAKARLDNVALRDPTAIDHTMTVAELQKLAPSFGWAAYAKAAGIAWTAQSALNVTEPAFVRELERQLTATPIADWRTYFAWHLIRREAPLLSGAVADASFGFFGRYLAGVKEMKPRWKRCVESTDRWLGEALGKKYTDRYFPPAAKARMQLLITNLLAAMKDTIDQLDWMSPQTKQRALAKLSTFNPKIGYPDTWKDYSSIPIDRARFWDSSVAARTWNVADNLSTIGKPVDRGRWEITPPTSDAYYNASLNEIVFPAGILQPPAFSVDAVDAVNYGAIGVVIGHEISHGFDDQGAQFDDQGRLHNWWTADDLSKFQARGACVVRQYEGYFVEPALHHNGRLVLGEAIGDSGGANLAYRAFQKAQQQSPAPARDGLTPDQQFFIAWGQFRGDETRLETQRMMIQGDPHPIAKYRVIGPLSNMPEFQAAFACKPDAAMVRPAAERCTVW